MPLDKASLGKLRKGERAKVPVAILLRERMAAGSDAALHRECLTLAQSVRCVRTAICVQRSDNRHPGGGGGFTAIVPGGSVTLGSTYTITINIPTNSTPPVPPADVAVTSVTIGGSATGISSLAHTSQYVITCTYAVPAGISPGAKNVVVNINGKVYTMTSGLTVN